MNDQWSIDDYRGPTDQRPVKTVLDGLSEASRDRVTVALEMLALEGNALRYPRSRSLGNGIFELRIALAEGPLRILYCFLPGRRVCLLHAFAKRTQKTPREDLKLARARQPRG